ncbi:MAG: L,D-transpeptidase [Desulforhopalus sp.]
MKIHLFNYAVAAVLLTLCFSANVHSSLLENNEEKLTLSFYKNNGLPVYFIVVEKSKQRLMVFEQQQSLQLLKTYTCATGENHGNKTVSGDSKTPEGVYFITEIYEDNKVTVFGSRAYHLDYPNVFDRHAGHLGDGIFIHGTNKALIPYSTNGCITLANEDLDELAVHLTVNTLPVIVVETLPEPLLGTNLTIGKNDRRFDEILHELSLDPIDGTPDNVENLSFLTFGSQAIASVYYRVFDGNSVEYRYHKRVYLTPALSKKWRTIYSVERQDIIPTIQALHPVKNRSAELPALPETAAMPMNIDEELLAFVEKWKFALNNNDLETFTECYSPSFKSGALDRNGWIKKKRYLNERYDSVKVDIEDIEIEWTDGGANVSFSLEYQTDQYRTSGTKRLKMVNRDSTWMIQKELM